MPGLAGQPLALAPQRTPAAEKRDWSPGRRDDYRPLGESDGHYDVLTRGGAEVKNPLQNNCDKL